MTTRRRFILLSALVSLWGFVGRAWGQVSPKRSMEVGLCAWLETLIPSDATSPGAGALHLETDLIRLAQETPQGYRLLYLGMRWADKEAQLQGSANFSALPAERANEIVAQAAAQPTGTGVRAFFEYSFRETKKIYYTKPESWVGLGIERPPQPMGYVDYTEVMK
ncbi:gluconate 2-dehydrogenase subunit 3 family protein [Coraliomargarita sp. W4R53]